MRDRGVVGKRSLVLPGGKVQEESVTVVVLSQCLFALAWLVFALKKLKLNRTTDARRPGQKANFMAAVTMSGPVPPTAAVGFMWTYFPETYTIGPATLNSASWAQYVQIELIVAA